MTITPRRRVLRRVAIALVVVVVLAVAGFLWWARPQPLLPEATAALVSTPDAMFQEGPGGRLTFTPRGEPPDTGLVLPAAKWSRGYAKQPGPAESASLCPLARAPNFASSIRGCRCVIAAHPSRGLGVGALLGGPRGAGSSMQPGVVDVSPLVGVVSQRHSD